MDEQIETVEGRKEEARVKWRENDRGRNRRIERAVISQVLQWFITQTHCRGTLLEATCISLSFFLSPLPPLLSASPPLSLNNAV